MGHRHPLQQDRLGRRACLGVLLLVGGLVACTDPRAESVVGLGVNLAGAEFGMEAPGYSNLHPGEHGQAYLFPSGDTMRWYTQQGLRILRLPLSWERLQPQPGGPLEPAYSERVMEQLDLAQVQGARLVLDLHAYGRYRLEAQGGVHELIVGAAMDAERGLQDEHLADLWLRLARRVHDHPALLAYGLMNEPHDMGDADWHRTSAEVVRALREAGDRNWIWVAGDGWSKAGEWTRHNPPRPWVDDPLDRTAYEAHLYFDADASGRYAVSFAEELAADPSAGARGRARLTPFLEWCEAGGVRGVIGEFGVPWYDAGWLPVLEEFLDEVRAARVTAVAWAGGDWWGDYALSLQPRGGEPVAPLQRMLQRDERPTP